MHKAWVVSASALILIQRGQTVQDTEPMSPSVCVCICVCVCMTMKIFQSWMRVTDNLAVLHIDTCACWYTRHAIGPCDPLSSPSTECVTACRTLRVVWCGQGQELGLDLRTEVGSKLPVSVLMALHGNTTNKLTPHRSADVFSGTTHQSQQCNNLSRHFNILK